MRGQFTRIRMADGERLPISGIETANAFGNCSVEEHGQK
jgi:hypothetical protein